MMKLRKTLVARLVVAGLLGSLSYKVPVIVAQQVVHRQGEHQSSGVEFKSTRSSALILSSLRYLENCQRYLLEARNSGDPRWIAVAEDAARDAELALQRLLARSARVSMARVVDLHNHGHSYSSIGIQFGLLAPKQNTHLSTVMGSGHSLDVSDLDISRIAMGHSVSQGTPQATATYHESPYSHPGYSGYGWSAGAHGHMH